VVCLTHISNATGIINPVETIIQMAHERQALVVLDAAQSISYLPLDVAKLDCDFMVFSGHKIYGPMGIGVLYGKKERLESMQPLRYGGGMISQVSAGQTTFRQAPQKFEAGTPPLAQALGLETALKFVQKIGRANLKSHADELTAFARHRLSSIRDLIIYPASGPTGPIVSFNLQDIHPHDVATILGEDNIAVRAGHHCTQPLMRHYKIPGTLRASFAIYNQKWEIDRMVESLHKVKQLLP
jgi:cysteine desulfurase/selenocysteine lyase